MIDISKKDEDRFYSKINVQGNADCWNWLGGLKSSSRGRGKFQYHNRTYTPQKFMWLLVNDDEIPEKHVVMNSCENFCCVNPRHLYLEFENNLYKSKLSIEDRFMSFVHKTDHCWEWMGTKSDGYGWFYWDGQEKAHRSSYRLFVGEIPDSLMVCHECDNPSCVNPKHLFLGTNSDNQFDCSQKGRKNSSRGEEHYNNKFKADEIIHMRSLRGLGWTLQSIANLYGTTFQYVSKVINRKVWKHIP